MAERSNKAKSLFLSNMSHDIRTPMNAIVNMTSFALDSFSNPKKQREYLNIIQESSDHLLHLINDILDMSRIESGQAVIASEPFSLKGELKKLSDIIEPLCGEKKLTYLTDFSEVSTDAILGDQVKVSQILLNLLSNAVKFTPPKGAIRFTAHERPSMKPELAEFEFKVEDNGIGIAPDSIEKIFEPFIRVDDKRVSRIEGTGLGLSICRSYVKAMGGEIRCESEENNGSIFTVSLVFRKADKNPDGESNEEPEWSEKPFIGKRCLVCEDNGTNRTIAKTMLERIGFVVELAENGKEGRDKFLLSKAGYYDIIYMDIQMPYLDGYQATVAIRESRHWQAKAIPIVAMTANVFAEDIEKARISGMDAHLGKPIIALDLIEVTSKLLGKQ